MYVLSVVLLFSLALCGSSLAANRRLRDVDRLPMQWGITGKVTWSAPRALALAFIPAVAVCVMTIYVVLAANLRPRSGQENSVISTLVGIGLMFIAVQLLHLWLIKTFSRGNGR